MTLRTIDLSLGPERVAPELDDVCRDIGFVRVGGHGIDPDLVTEMMAVCAEFFALPDERKQPSTPAPLNRGYTPVFAEQLGTTLDDDRVARPVHVPDLYESFTVGDPAREDLDGIWPAGPARFAEVWRAWWGEMNRVGGALLECCAPFTTRPHGDRRRPGTCEPAPTPTTGA